MKQEINYMLFIFSVLILRFIFWLQWGKVTEGKYCLFHDQGLVCEMQYTNRKGITIGYWAYGFYDPQLPYQGQPFIKVHPNA